MIDWWLPNGAVCASAVPQSIVGEPLIWSQPSLYAVKFNYSVGHTKLYSHFVFQRVLCKSHAILFICCFSVRFDLFWNWFICGTRNRRMHSARKSSYQRVHGYGRKHRCINIAISSDPSLLFSFARESLSVIFLAFSL